MIYRYETHAHTSLGSLCGRISPQDLAAFYAAQGFSGLILTEHFFNGNSTVLRDLPWVQRVERYFDAYHAVKTAGAPLGLDVFYGWEYSYFGTDWLVYNLSQDWMLHHPESMELSTSEYMNYVRSEGAFVVQAHPFREAGYIEMIRLLPRCVDAVETINACRTDFENAMANAYAENYGLLKFAGSDNHVGWLPYLSGIELPQKITCTAELTAAVQQGEARLFTQPCLTK